MTYTNVNVRIIRPLPHEFRHFLGPHIFLTNRPSVHTKPNNSLTKTASSSKRSPDVCILDKHNGFANSCRRSKPDIFEFNSGPVHTKPVVPETRHVVTRIRVDGVIQCFYRDFVHWGQQVSVYTKSGHFWNRKYCYPNSCGRSPYSVLTRISYTGVHRPREKLKGGREGVGEKCVTTFRWSQLNVFTGLSLR